MIVFLSWSGNRSKALAQAFDKWIQSVVQAVKPFFSPDDIEKGTFWFSEINAVLIEAKTSVIFVTPENKDRPWLLFEAGALASKLGKPKIIPLLFEMQPRDLQGPLPNLNAAVFSKEEVKRVVIAINGQLPDQKLEAKVLDDVFEKWWPDLEEAVTEALALAGEEASERRNSDDILEELLALSRSTQIQIADLDQRIAFTTPRGSGSIRPLLSAHSNDEVAAALNFLPNEYRDVLILTDLERAPSHQCHEILELDLATYRARLEVARAMMRESFARLRHEATRSTLLS